MFLAPISICVGNFPARMRGAIIGVTSCFYLAAPAIFGVIYARFYQEGPVGNFFLPLVFLCTIASLLSMWVLRPLPLQIDNNIDKGEEIAEVQRICFYTDDGSNQANTWYMRLGIGVMKLPAFHILSWCYLLSNMPQISIFYNITTMATSFGHTGLAVSLPIYGPMLGLLITPAVGFISDRTLKYVSRLIYIFIVNLPQIIFYILSIFCGDNPYIFSGFVLSAFIQHGLLLTITPTLITEYFGRHYFMRIWGAEVLTGALLLMIMNAVTGVLYQNAITDGGIDCYGLVCFQNSFILGSVMSGVSLSLCGIMWYIERKKAQEYERLN